MKIYNNVLLITALGLLIFGIGSPVFAIKISEKSADITTMQCPAITPKPGTEKLGHEMRKVRRTENRKKALMLLTKEASKPESNKNKDIPMVRLGNDASESIKKEPKWESDVVVASTTSHERGVNLRSSADGAYLYSAFELWNGTTAPDRIRVRYSIDRGETGWSTNSITIDDTHILSLPYMTITPDYVYIIYEHAYSSTDHDILYTKISVGSNTPTITSEIVDYSGNFTGRPYIASDALEYPTDYYLYAVASDVTEGMLKFYISYDAGETWEDGVNIGAIGTSGAEFASIAFANGLLHVAYCGTDAKIYYTRSGDYGSTWSTPAQIANSTYAHRYPEITAKGNFVIMTYEYLYGGDDWDVRYSYSINGGSNWTINNSLSSSSSYNERFPSVSIDLDPGNDVYVGYANLSGTNYGNMMYTKASTVNPTSWSTAVQINDNDDMISNDDRVSISSSFDPGSGNGVAGAWVQMVGSDFDVYYDASWRPFTTNQPGWDHLTITSATLKASFDSLKYGLYNYLGLSDTVVTVEYIYANTTGTDNQDRIRNYIMSAVNDHGTQYVLLAGDATVVPYRKTYSGRSGIGASGWTAWHDTIPCDLYYADLDGDWDDNGNGVYGEPGDNIDIYPDVYLGRIPVTTVAQAQLYSKKYNRYYSNDNNQDNIMLAGFDLDASTFTEQTLETYANSSYYIPTNYSLNRVYDSYSEDHRQAVLNGLNDGQNIFIHSDHGNTNIFSTGDLSLNNTDMDDLTNGPEYTVFLSIACLIGAFDVDCITEHYINCINGGGIAAITNSRYGWYSSGVNPQTDFSFAYLSRMIHRLLSNSPGQAQELLIAKSELAGLALGNSTYRWSMYALNLFGDPTLEVHVPYVNTGIEENITEASLIAKNTELLTCWPNPMHNNIYLKLDMRTRTIVNIYNITGQLIRRLYAGTPPEKGLKLNWDGKDDQGRRVGTGVYFIRQTSSENNKTAKVQLIR